MDYIPCAAQNVLVAHFFFLMLDVSEYLSILLFKVFLFFFNFWLCWVFVATLGLSLVVASWGYFPLWCTGLLSQRLLCCGPGL